MGKIKTWLRNTLGKLLGKNLCYQMVFLYTIGGALPVILIGLYLIQGTNRVLVEREKQAELTVLPEGEHNLMGPGELEKVLRLSQAFFLAP